MRLILLFISIVAALFKLGGEPEVVVNEPPYARVVLNDNATLETYEYAQGDTVLVVLTVCAPECSSCARIYNKEGSYHHPTLCVRLPDSHDRRQSSCLERQRYLGILIFQKLIEFFGDTLVRQLIADLHV